MNVLLKVLFEFPVYFPAKVLIVNLSSAIIEFFDLLKDCFRGVNWNARHQSQILIVVLVYVLDRLVDARNRYITLLGS